MKRRTLLLALPLAAARAGSAAEGPREIEVVARRYRYEPAEISVAPGERVVLAFRALDFVHGFSVPDLKLRADLPPGLVTRVELPPLAPGVVEFLCDNFCGEGHETMQGRIVVGTPPG